jgi:predicted ArsR family transcriptional regulator
VTRTGGRQDHRDIGQILGLSPRTVDKHLEQIYSKLGVENRTAAAAIAANRPSALWHLIGAGGTARRAELGHSARQGVRKLARPDQRPTDCFAA